jgi:hypothetical protein
MTAKYYEIDGGWLCHLFTKGGFVKGIGDTKAEALQSALRMTR